MKTVDYKITSLTANYQYHRIKGDILQKKGKNTQLGPVRKKTAFLLKTRVLGTQNILNTMNEPTTVHEKNGQQFMKKTDNTHGLSANL